MDGIIVDNARWAVELNIECPKCDNYFDYLETEEYRIGGFESLKHQESDDNANIKVKCPECGVNILVKSTCY